MHVRSWWKTYHANFTHSITCEVIETARRPDHLRGHEEITMTPESPLSPAVIAEWIFAIATRLLARSLNMPEPLVVSTGAYVYAQVTAAETRAAKSLCPFALARRLRAWLHDLIV
jgi:hypothetical protein